MNPALHYLLCFEQGYPMENHQYFVLIAAMDQHHNPTTSSRRKFMQQIASGLAGFPLLSESLPALPVLAQENFRASVAQTAPPTSIIGHYGPWAASLLEDPPALSFRQPTWKKVDSWRGKALAKLKEYLAVPDTGGVPKVTVHRQYEYDGLSVEELSWQLPYGRPTEAILLKPAGNRSRLPAILGLHDHGGNKYFGKRKITRTASQLHPLIPQHQEDYYSGLAWANEIAKRGYVVLVHDTFTFGSRRVLYQDVSGINYGPLNVENLADNPENPEYIKAYNEWAGLHEHVMSKSLFCAGTTWPGVFLAEDQRALDVLSAREEVDPDRIGCAGLSGGGLRTAYLGGVDPRIKCAVCVGFMSTWKDFLLYKSYTHTWMTYIPIIPQYLDFPEIFGLRAPLATMTLNNNEDGLFTLPEMKRADAILQEIFDKAGAGEKYSGKFYPGIHKFDADMQSDAFAWFDQWL